MQSPGKCASSGTGQFHPGVLLVIVLILAALVVSMFVQYGSTPPRTSEVPDLDPTSESQIHHSIRVRRPRQDLSLHLPVDGADPRRARLELVFEKEEESTGSGGSDDDNNDDDDENGEERSRNAVTKK